MDDYNVMAGLITVLEEVVKRSEEKTFVMQHEAHRILKELKDIVHQRRHPQSTE